MNIEAFFLIINQPSSCSWKVLSPGIPHFWVSNCGWLLPKPCWQQHHLSWVPFPWTLLELHPYESSHKFYVQHNYRWNNGKWWNHICLFFHDLLCYHIYFMYHQIVANSFHNYLFFVLKFIVWVFKIPMAMLLGMCWFIALTAYHIYFPSFANFFLLGWWFQQFPVFIGISHIFSQELSCVWTRCPSSSPLWLSRNMVVNLFERK